MVIVKNIINKEDIPRKENESPQRDAIEPSVLENFKKVTIACNSFISRGVVKRNEEKNKLKYIIQLLQINRKFDISLNIVNISNN